MMEKTLVILKPCTLQRGLVGEIINRFERKGLRLALSLIHISVPDKFQEKQPFAPLQSLLLFCAMNRTIPGHN